MIIKLTKYMLKCLNAGIKVCGNNEEGPGEVTVEPPEEEGLKICPKLKRDIKSLTCGLYAQCLPADCQGPQKIGVYATPCVCTNCNFKGYIIINRTILLKDSQCPKCGCLTLVKLEIMEEQSHG